MSDKSFDCVFQENGAKLAYVKWDCRQYNWPDYKQYILLTEKGDYRLRGSYHRDVGIDTVK